jgi:hypothetical protein
MCGGLDRARQRRYQKNVMYAKKMAPMRKMHPKIHSQTRASVESFGKRKEAMLATSSAMAMQKLYSSRHPGRSPDSNNDEGAHFATTTAVANTAPRTIAATHRPFQAREPTT